MKKITLLLTTLSFSLVSFAQSITLGNTSTIGTSYFQGQTVKFQIDLTDIDGNFEIGFTGGPDLPSASVTIDAAATTTDLGAFVGSFGDNDPNETNTFINLTSRTVNDGTVTLDIVIPSDFTFPAGDTSIQSELVLTLNGTTAGNQSITILSDESTLSIDDNTTINELVSYYSTTNQVIVIENSVDEDFAIYDLAGKVVLKGAITNEINVETLSPGIYIFNTATGNLKFAK